jgi:hypothetical protein
MLGGYSQQLYFLIAITTAALLTFTGTKKYRIITLIITFWILGGSVIHLGAYNLPLRMLGGEMQIKRFLLLILSAYLFFLISLKPQLREKLKSLPFEIFFYALVFLYIIIIGYHYFDGLFNKREFIGMIEGMMIVFVIYMIIKRTADSDIIKVIGRAMILVAVFSSLVAIVQFFGNPWFLRIGGALPAFGGKFRSNGIFHTEYTHSYVAIAALIVTLVGMSPGRLKQGTIGLLLVGIALSFHRMSWLITVFVLMGYFILYKRKSLRLITLVFPFVISAVLFIALELFPVVEYLEGTSFYSERLSVNTWETRQKLNEMVFRQFDRIAIVGAGSTKSNLYYYSIMDADLGEEWATGARGGFHNLYVYYLFVYGLPFVLLFSVFLISTVLYFFRMVAGGKHVFLVPLLFIVMYIIMNMSNSFPLEADFGFYVGLFLGCSAAVACGSNVDINKLIGNATSIQ